MNIVIHAIGKERSPELTNLIAKYKKRISWNIVVNEHTFNKSASVNEIKSLEGKLLLVKSSKNAFKIALDETGNQLSSIDFAGLLLKNINHGKIDIEFFIGGAYGLSEELKQKCDYMLALSRMTFAHKIVRLILMEQIYRAYSIINKHPYHK